MATKQELIQQAVQSHKTADEYTFVDIVKSKLKCIAENQRHIEACKKNIAAARQDIRELEFEPFDESILE